MEKNSMLNFILFFITFLFFSRFRVKSSNVTFWAKLHFIRGLGLWRGVVSLFYGSFGVSSYEEAQIKMSLSLTIMGGMVSCSFLLRRTHRVERERTTFRIILTTLRGY